MNLNSFLKMFYITIFLSIFVITVNSFAVTVLEDGPCLGETSNDFSLSCTANDLETPVLRTVDVTDFCINFTGDTATAKFFFIIVSTTSPQRYDLGAFIPEDGLDPIGANASAECTLGALIPDQTTCGNVGMGTADPALDVGTTTNGGPPFFEGSCWPELETGMGGVPDVCGDYTQVLGEHVLGYEATFDCVDSDMNGIPDITYALAWDNNRNTACNAITDVEAGTGAKCVVETVNIPEVIQSDVTITKVCTFADQVDNPDLLDCTITLTNNGAEAVDDLTIHDDYDETQGSVSMISAIIDVTPDPDIDESGEVDDDGDRLIWHLRDDGLPNDEILDSLLPGETATLEYRYDANVQGSTNDICNIATVRIGSVQTIIGSAEFCFNTVPVSIQSFESSYFDGGIRVDWTTSSEAYNFGFNIYGIKKTGRKIQLNDKIILSQDGDSFEPQHYTVILPSNTSEKYEALSLSAIDTLGDEEVHGPYEIGSTYGEVITTEFVDWQSIKQEHDKNMLKQGYSLKKGTWRKNNKNLLSKVISALKIDSGNSVCHVEVSEEGVHRVTAQELADNGCDFNGEKSNNIAVTFKGEPVSRYISDNKGKFNNSSFIDFYAFLPEGEDGLYISKNIYQIELDKSSANKHTNSKQKVGSIDTTFYQKGIKIAKQAKYTISSPTGDPFYEERMTVSQNSEKGYLINFNISDPLVSSNGKLRVHLGGAVDFPGITPDHHIKLYLNDTQVGKPAGYYEDGAANWIIETQVSNIKQGPNTVEIRLIGDTGYIGDALIRESTELVYETALNAVNDQISFESSGNNIEVTGFTTDSVVGYGLLENQLYKLSTKSIKNGNKYNVKFKGIGNNTKYWLSTDSGLQTANVYEFSDPGDLLSGNADILIISNPTLMVPKEDPGDSDIYDYISDKESEGYSVKLVDIKDVYEKYGYGMHTPGAIRDYVKEAELALNLTHVVLVGGGTYDYHGYLNPDVTSLIPTFYRLTNDIMFFTPCDGCLVDTVGEDDTADLSLGRFPARVFSDLSNMIQKTGHTPGDKALIVAGALDSNGLNFKNQLETIKPQVLASFPPGNVIDIYSDDIGGEEVAKEKFIENINAGNIGTVIYSGHGSVSSWNKVFSHNNVVNNSGDPDIMELSNTLNPVGFLPLTCYTSYYQTINTNTLAHKLMSSNVGARYISGASVLSSYNENGVFADSILEFMNNGLTIGEAVKETKQKFPNLKNQVVNWTLLGDPTDGL